MFRKPKDGGAMQGSRRVAIVNRGEAAVRFLHTASAQEIPGLSPLTTIALYTRDDRRSLFVRLADEAYDLTTFPVGDPNRADTPYLDPGRLLTALQKVGADLVWPGWGFLAEDADFVERCENSGITVVGPSAASMRELGNKISAKFMAERAGVPVVPWTGGPVATALDARAHAERLGFPVVLKSAAGGGGRGIREIGGPAEVKAAFESAQREAERAFGDPTLFLEKRVDGGRHIEVQILADDAGTVWPVGLRECSIQRRRQKLLEEGGLAAHDPGLAEELSAHAVRICQEAGYRNAGTVEFLVERSGWSAYFMEVNARLQVEHTVTEATTGLDLVAEQLRIAAGGLLIGAVPASRGHAVEVRLNAEDPDHGFAPAPGRLAVFRTPSGPGIRVDSGVTEGDTISSAFDAMIAKVIATGPDRPTALRRLRHALAATDVVVEGGASNKAFLEQILAHPAVLAGPVSTQWLDNALAEGDLTLPTDGAVALIQAAVEEHRARNRQATRGFLASVMHGRPDSMTPDPVVRLRLGQHTHALQVEQLGTHTYRVRLPDGAAVDVRVLSSSGYERQVLIGRIEYRTFVLRSAEGFLVDVNGVPHRVGADDAGAVKASFPGVVVTVHVVPGATVSVGDALLTVESMKLESVVRAPVTGTVAAVHVDAHSQITAGEALVELRPADRDPAADDDALPSFADLIVSQDLDPLALLRGRIMGFADPSLLDVDGAKLLPPAPHPDDQARSEAEILSLFCDVQALAPATFDGTSAARESLFDYLRKRHRHDYAVSADLADRLESALRHYRSDTGDHSTGGGDGGNVSVGQDGTDEHFARIGQAIIEISTVEAPLATILQRWLAAEIPIAPDLHTQALLDRLIEVSDARAPKLGGLARAIRSRLFVEPALAADRAAATQLLLAQALELSDDKDSEQRLLSLRRLAARASWDTWVRAWSSGPSDAPWEPMLTLVASGLYQHRRLHRLALPMLTHRRAVAAEEIDGGTTATVVVTLADEPNIGPALQSVIDARSPLGPVTIELVTPAGDSTLDPALAAHLGGAARVTVLSAPPSAVDGGYSRTYEPRVTGGTLVEAPAHRNLHPLLAERLELWRLDNFELEPVRIGESLLFAGVSREDPRDKRLFALADVATAAPMHDATGAITSVPGVELAILRCLDSIRAHDAGFRRRNPYGWNRVIVSVNGWDLPLDAVRIIAGRVAHATVGLSLDRVVLRLRGRQPDGSRRDEVIHLALTPDAGVQMVVATPSEAPIRTLRGHRRAAAELRRRGLVHPWDVLRILTSAGVSHSDLPRGTFAEYDLVDGALQPVHREPAANEAAVIVGLVENLTAKHPDGLRRVAILNDPSKRMAALGEPECARIVAALQLAERERLPVEWFATSSGAEVSMERGTESLDWTARVLRQIIESTQRGLEINVVLTGVNVGAQAYWDAEATMLMHTRGVLIAVADHAMVLTGKQALDYSGAVSAEDNAGIGGYTRIMGPNGQAQYWAPNVERACGVLFRHYDVSYVAPDETTVRRRPTTDPVHRDAGASPHHLPDSPEFTTVGDIVDDTLNADRKRPFDIRAVMTAIGDTDDAPLERWPHMVDAENAIVWDVHVGGIPVTMIGIASQDLPRRSAAANDGPRRWSAGTLYPRSSKKIARSLNAASGIRPAVILANLSGFDGSPESMASLQLEYGAEIGRAVVNCRTPLIFCVLSRYHGGAFVVFSKALNERMEVLALHGAKASVLGGAPAAAVVFTREVAHRVSGDPRVAEARERLAAAEPGQRAQAEQQLAQLTDGVRTEVRGQIAREFDSIHTIERAARVGSVDRIVAIDQLRNEIAAALAAAYPPAGDTNFRGVRA